MFGWCARSARVWEAPPAPPRAPAKAPPTSRRAPPRSLAPPPRTPLARTRRACERSLRSTAIAPRVLPVRLPAAVDSILGEDERRREVGVAGADERRDGIQQLDLHGAIVARHNRQPLGHRVVLTESAGAQVGAARLALGFEADVDRLAGRRAGLHHALLLLDHPRIGHRAKVGKAEEDDERWPRHHRDGAREPLLLRRRPAHQIEVHGQDVSVRCEVRRQARGDAVRIARAKATVEELVVGRPRRVQRCHPRRAPAKARIRRRRATARAPKQPPSPTVFDWPMEVTMSGLPAVQPIEGAEEWTAVERQEAESC